MYQEPKTKSDFLIDVFQQCRAIAAFPVEIPWEHSLRDRASRDLWIMRRTAGRNGWLCEFLDICVSVAKERWPVEVAA